MRFLVVTCLAVSLAIQPGAHSATQSATPTEPGTIVGSVTQAQTSESLEGVQVTLEIEPTDPEVRQILLASAASAGIFVTPPAKASLSEITTLLINTAAAQGLSIGPPLIRNMVNEALEGTPWPTAVSDRNGRFGFAQVPPGKYTLRAYGDAFFGKPHDGVHPPTASVDVVTSGMGLQEVSLSMVQGGALGGRVYDVSGQTLPDADVRAFRVVYPDGFAVLQSIVAVATDERGEYRLFIPPGDYYIGVTPRRMLAATGLQGGKTFYPGVTTVVDATRVPIRGGEDLNGMDIRVQAAPAFRISGQVTSLLPIPTDRRGSPISVSAALLLVNRHMNVPNELSGAYRFGGNVPLNPLSGLFMLTNVEPGSYEVFARISDYGHGTVWGRALVDVRDRDVHNVSVFVDRSIDLRGFVRLIGNATLPAGIGVMLMPEGSAAKIPQYQSIGSKATPVGPDGNFQISGVPQGRFRLRLVGLSHDLYIADVRRDGQSVFDSGFEAGSNSSDRIEIFVSAGAATVEGAVLTGAQTHVAGATVALIPEDKRRENHALYLSARTDDAGKFKIQGIAPGSYKLFAWESIAPNAFRDTGFMTAFENHGRVIQIESGETVNLDLTVLNARP